MTSPLDKGVRRTAEIKEHLNRVFRQADGREIATTREFDVAFDAVWREMVTKFTALSPAKDQVLSHVLWHLSRLAEDNMAPTRTEVRDEILEISEAAETLAHLLDKLSPRAEHSMISAISDHELPPLPTEPIDEDEIESLISDYPALYFLNNNPNNSLAESKRGIETLSRLLRRGLNNLPEIRATPKERQQEWLLRFIENIDDIFYSNVSLHLYSTGVKGTNKVNWLYSLCRLVDPTARDGLVDQIVSHLSTQPR